MQINQELQDCELSACFVSETGERTPIELELDCLNSTEFDATAGTVIARRQQGKMDEFEGAWEMNLTKAIDEVSVTTEEDDQLLAKANPDTHSADLGISPKFVKKIKIY